MQDLSQERSTGVQVSLPLGVRAPRRLVARVARVLDGIVPGTVRLRLTVAGNDGSRVLRPVLVRPWRSVTLPEVPVDQRPSRLNGEVLYPSAVEQLAAHVLDALDPRDGAPWQVRAYVVRAVKLWEAHGSAAVDDCRRVLQAAVAGDPLGPVVNYALGALAYNQYEEQSTRQGIRHFAVAYSAAGRLGDSLAGLAGLVLCGLALTHCQLYHRFGEETVDVLASSRTAARMAVATSSARLRRLDRRHVPPRVRRAAVEGYALARYAEAFAQHVTWRREDASAAIPLYGEAIGALERAGLPVPAVLYNNLGYQYMTVAGRLERGPDEESYRTARALFDTAVRCAPDYHFGWANLGNLHRLRGDWDDAEQCYREALRITERRGQTYPPGWNELACVLVEAGRDIDADHCHRQALAVATASPLRARFRAEYGHSLLLVGRIPDARASAERGLEEDPGNSHCLVILGDIHGDERATA